jgi:diacylglycerol kinase family enzyme
VANGAKKVVAVGGDGTIREVASALIHTDTPLGIVSCGTATTSSAR